MTDPLKRFVATALVLAVATLLWLPAVGALFRPDPTDLSTSPAGPRARALLGRQLALWEEPALRAAALEPMRRNNPEWDFMGRTYLVMALGNVALSEPDLRERALAAIDAMLEDTLRLEQERGPTHFLLPYVHRAPFRSPVAGSVFVDGEVAMMLATRQLVSPSERWRLTLRERVQRVEAELEAGPLLSAESYPDECWTFCNTFALAALRVSDASTGLDHRDLAARWLALARERLVDPQTGMLVSSYTWDGRHLDGPEGSSLFMVAHSLMLVDPAFARAQFELGRAHLSQQFLGFGWAREWPRTWVGPADVDSGPIVPFVDASAGASGLAVLGASAFGDREMLSGLLASLDLAAFPEEGAHGLRYAASNQVGDAVLLYALTFGPLWQHAASEGPS